MHCSRRADYPGSWVGFVGVRDSRDSRGIAHAKKLDDKRTAQQQQIRTLRNENADLIRTLAASEGAPLVHLDELFQLQRELRRVTKANGQTS